MPPLLRLLHVMSAVAIAAHATRAGAQSDTAATLGRSLSEAVLTVSGDSVDRLRLAELDGVGTPAELMLRSTSSLSDPRRYGLTARRFTIISPYLAIVANSELPFGQNDGALWASKGANIRALAGFTATLGALRIVALPEVVYSANSALSITPLETASAPPLPPSRSRFSSPFNVYPYSIDLPYRFGETSLTRVHPGQSSVTLRAGVIEAGAATENEWWGPAIRNPLVLGDNAPGFPHAFVRTSGWLSGPLGNVEARFIVGGLKESDFFNADPGDDVRSISALGVAWRRSVRSQFTIGVTRAVIGPVSGYGGVPGAFLDVFRNVGHPDARALTDTAFVPGPDQIVSLFGRWAIPRYGLESYVEWARTDFPVSLRDFLEQPNHSRGYTTGLQWTRADSASGSRVRVMGEVTNVEQSSTFTFRHIGSWYTSRSVPQGFTNDGRILGAGAGPGSSAQYFAADYFRGGWGAGFSLGRTRFNNDAFFLLRTADRCGHDVSVYPGVGGSFTTRYMKVKVDLVSVSRYNTFFGNIRGTCLAGGEGSDRHNNSLSLTVVTFGW